MRMVEEIEGSIDMRRAQNGLSAIVWREILFAEL